MLQLTSLAPSVGRTEQSEATIEVLKTIEAPLGKVAITMVQMFSYAATGNVVEIQALLREATDHLDPKKESDLHQAMAVIGVAFIAMGEEVGSQMSVRHFNHLVRRSRSFLAPLRADSG